LQSGRQWLASEAPPFFSLVLKNSLTGEQVEMDAARGWSEVSIDEIEDGFELVLRDPEAITPEPLEVRIRAAVEEDGAALAWTLRVVPRAETWGVWAVQFPRVAMAEPGENGCLFLPRGPGEAAQNAWRQEFDFQQIYPNGWCSMSYFAFYEQPAEGEAGRGLYLGFHDPRGSAKDFRLKSDPVRSSLEFGCEYPAKGGTGRGNALPGRGSWSERFSMAMDDASSEPAAGHEHGAWMPRERTQGTPAGFAIRWSGFDCGATRPFAFPRPSGSPGRLDCRWGFIGTTGI
jgi:hypothetical protein